MKKINPLLLAVFFIALFTRFLFFEKSTYFGYDEARDAYISISIYKDLDIKIIGPPANFPGMFHGPLFWYLIGPFYILGGGNPYIVNAFFRIINALGVFIVFSFCRKIFNPTVGLTAAFLYAVSFEETQYAMYLGNPSLATLSFLFIFYGLSRLIKEKDGKGLILMFAGAAISLQLEIILAYSFIVVFVLLFIFKKEIRKIEKKYWAYSILVSLGILSTFLISQVKFGFSNLFAILKLIRTGYDVIPPGETRISFYISLFIKLFQFNILNLEKPLIFGIIIPFFFYLFYLAKKDIFIRVILIWIFSPLLLMPFGGYNALYTFVGIGVGFIVALSIIIERLARIKKSLAYLILILVFFSNIYLILNNNKKGLIVEIKAQPGMLLSDELLLIDRLYEYANGKGFTLRVVSMPYRIQTVWAYLLNYRGKRWGYLPFWETELIKGYPGSLPRPVSGTTCLRFFIREPVRGIPEVLINKEIGEENLFSEVVEEEYIGQFLLQIRQARGECHNRKV